MGCSSEPKTKEDNKAIKTLQNENKPNEVKKEEKQEKKEEIKQETNIPPQPKKSSFNKDLCKSIASSLPKRTKIEFQPFKELLKSKTINLSDKEKSFRFVLQIRSFSFWRRHPDLNRGSRCCRPLPYHLAIAP